MQHVSVVALLDFSVQDISGPLVVKSINYLLSPMACQTLQTNGANMAKLGAELLLEQ